LGALILPVAAFTLLSTERRAGYIALELGQMFHRLGSKVTILGRNPRLLPREEPEIG